MAGGAYELQACDRQDVAAAVEIMERYADLELGLTDASVMVLAHRFGCLDLLTLDQRHFRAVVDASGRPFRLLPHDASLEVS